MKIVGREGGVHKKMESSVNGERASAWTLLGIG